MFWRSTIQSPIRFEGVGIHSGKTVVMILQPAEAGVGRRFFRQDMGVEVPVVPTSIQLVMRATGLSHQGVSVCTPEHVLSALAAAGVSDCRIVLNSEEVPILDGSAAPFLDEILRVGVVKLPVEWVPIKVTEPFSLTEGDAKIEVFPSEDPIFEYELSYPAPVGTQTFSLVLELDNYVNQIASARTFGFFNEYDQLVRSGLAKGASFENALVVMDDGSYSSAPRFWDEPVRHKILDMVGDFAILGRPLRAKVVGHKSGHALNLKAVQKIWQDLSA